MTGPLARPLTEDAEISRDMALRLIRSGLDGAFSSCVRRLEASRDGQPLPPFQVPETSALASVAAIFHLDPIAQEVLCLAAGAEIDPGISAAIARLDPGGAWNTALLERLFGPQIWDVLCPEAPLRHWRLVESVGSGPLRRREIRIDERLLHYLRGVAYVDARLAGILIPIQSETKIDTARRSALYQRLVQAWSDGDKPPVLLLGGRDGAAKRDIFARACEDLGVQAFRLDAADIPADWNQRNALGIFVDRELALSGGAVLIEHDELDGHGAAAATLADALSSPVAVGATDPHAGTRAPRLRVELETADRDERRILWTAALGGKAEALAPAIDSLTEQFALDTAGVYMAAATALGTPAVDPAEAADRLWQAAREQGRRRLDGLADRIESRVGWKDIVLPADATATLNDLSKHLKHASRVNRDWGWAAKSERGLGTAALFAGPSGTGKTLAAEILANELKLDLFRIDLSQVVSKYIGETEKNLSRIFAAAEDSGGILLFDEADALFGKRSEVKDSHDRYANVEVSYLLQRMEAYRGLAILTTNQRSAVDQAFLRRLRYVVTFPFPNAEARAAIWAQIFPPDTPVAGLDPARLARLNIAGGGIRSIALNATFLAAATGEPVCMSHIGLAARREYDKLEKPFTAAEAGAFR